MGRVIVVVVDAVVILIVLIILIGIIILIVFFVGDVRENRSSVFVCCHGFLGCKRTKKERQGVLGD